MKTINRGVIIIKPKRPLLDWVNRTLALSSPISMENLERDRTAILVPELYSLEDMLDYLEPLQPLLFEMELGSWSLDPATWPQDRTPEMFDAWFDLEAHSMVWDAVDAPIEKDEEAMNLTGTWNVVFSPDFDDDYLHVETTPYVTLQQDDTGVRGEFHIGLIVGSLFGLPEGDRILFSFEATDETEPVNGAGIITLQGERLILQFLFHLGDVFAFECVRRR